MKKIVAILVLVILVGAGFLSGCMTQDSEDEHVVVIAEDDAFDILIDEILDPSSSDSKVSSFMLSEMLEPGDVVTSDSGETYTIDEYTWFIFIDDAPWAFFAHPTRYVFINAETGETKVIDEFWPPLINDYSMWDSVNHSRGDVKKSYPILNKSVPIVTDFSTGATSADYGDAPDTQNAYYGIVGAFPTYYNTTNSRVGQPGGHTLVVGQEMLGLTVSAEVDANDPNDPDVVANLVDSDKDERMFVNLNQQSAQLSFTVTVNQSAPDVIRYINVLIDFDQNGSWMNGAYGSEWVVINYQVNVTPGTSKTITTSSFSWGNGSNLPSPVWMRVSLTREKVNQTLFSNVGGWDGSGQFEYGEIEDHIVYLTDDSPDPDDQWPPFPKNPPKGGNPEPPQPPGGGPQPPGPTKGPCGSDVNYYCIIINGGDSSSDLGKGMSPAAEAAGKITDLADDQGYNTVANLGPGQGSSGNSMANIAQALENLKGQVKCGDHVLIYIVGHGKKDGGITLRGTDGKTDETMKPQDLSDLLGTIPSCPDEDCDVAGKCCHVTVVIESCYAGNFNKPGVTGQGRTVMGSCDDEPADATGGGTFTSGFVGASSNNDSDTDDDDDVDPQEAFEGAAGDVEEKNKASGGSQEPWSDSQECECKCPCHPSIDVDKSVLDGEEWVSEMDAYLGATVLFKIEVENDGKCRNVSDLEMVDALPSCLSYGDDAEVSYTDAQGQVTDLSISPSMSDTADGGLGLTWDIGSEIGLFASGESILIEYSATTQELGDNTNYANGSARCTYDSSIIVTDSDSVTVNVIEEPEDALPPVEDVLFLSVEGYAKCYCNAAEYLDILHITINATDLTAGEYLLSNIVAKVNGVTEYSEEINATSYQESKEIEFTNGQHLFTVEVIATNVYGQELIQTTHIIAVK